MAKRFKARKCATKLCRGLTTSGCHSPYCGKCRTRRWKAAYPAHEKFNNLRKRAKQRGHTFTMTREKYVELWDNWLKHNHGRAAWAFTIDRIKSSKGYSDDNVQVLTRSENSRKEYVPFFRKQFHQEARDERDIKEAEAAVAAMMAEETNQG